MRGRNLLAFFEQLVMLLIFAMSAAICVQAFVLAGQMSRRSAARDQAMVHAQSMAEVYKHNRGDAQRCAEQYGGEASDGVWTVWYDGTWTLSSRQESVYTLRAAPEKTDSPYLGRAELSASGGDGTLHCALSVAWQKEAGT